MTEFFEIYIDKNKCYNKSNIIIYESGDILVELDQFKYTLNSYEKPLKEVGDSL